MFSGQNAIYPTFNISLSLRTKNNQFNLNFFKDHLEKKLLPFWEQALDHHNGGVYTCFNNDGSILLSKKKYIWSQGRFLWIWSRIAREVSEGRIEGVAESYYQHLHKTVNFLEQHAILENGNCAFLLSESGDKIESVPGEGFDTSFYSDCFMVIGLAEYSALFKDEKRFEEALELYFRIERRLKTEETKSEPYQVPLGYKHFSLTMIILNVVQQLADVAGTLNHKRQRELFDLSLDYSREIMDHVILNKNRMAEMHPKDASHHQTLLARHVNPGHTMEAMWLVMHTANKANKQDWIKNVSKVIKKAFEIGWDSKFGGIFHHVDQYGGKPIGERGNSPYESSMIASWDCKLWWVHSEALYATLLCYQLTGDHNMRLLFYKIKAYTFSTFPNPDDKIGEWIQIRDRMGNPFDRVVALPVKDPFHILRNILLITELNFKD